MKILKSLPLSIILFSLSFAQFYNVDIETTGQSQLIIFQDAITGLEAGDEIGIFDNNGIVGSGGNTGELLVGPAPEEGQSTTLLWTGEQLEGVAISSVDLSQFGGPILPGYQDGNPVIVKVYRSSTGVEYDTNLSFSAGTGTYGDLFMAVSEVELIGGSGSDCEDAGSSLGFSCDQIINSFGFACDGTFG